MAPNGTKNGSLNPRQEAAALALARGATIAEAAEGCGAGERTVKRWLTTPAFRRRVSDLRGRLTDTALGQLCNHQAAAADTLAELLQARSEMVRLSAARSILELGVKLRESTELEERITALESNRQ
jgi:hypothetical protein